MLLRGDGEVDHPADNNPDTAGECQEPDAASQLADVFGSVSRWYCVHGFVLWFFSHAKNRL